MGDARAGGNLVEDSTRFAQARPRPWLLEAKNSLFPPGRLRLPPLRGVFGSKRGLSSESVPALTLPKDSHWVSARPPPPSPCPRALFIPPYGRDVGEPQLPSIRNDLWQVAHKEATEVFIPLGALPTRPLLIYATVLQIGTKYIFCFFFCHYISIHKYLKGY